jgi:hypothetical protein
VRSLAHPCVVIAVLAAVLAGACASTESLVPGSPSVVATATSSRRPDASASVPSTADLSPAPTRSGSPPKGDLFGLANATLDVPLRPGSLKDCAQGPRTKFVKGRSGAFTTIGIAAQGDVDHDGAPDVIAGIDCSQGEGRSRQLVAFHRGTGGAFTTIGLVVQAFESDDHDNQIFSVYDMEITASGEIRVDVGDYPTIFSDGFAAQEGIRQSRTYGWNGSTFAQTAGSTSFAVPVGAFELSVDVSPMTYAEASQGQRLGTLSVMIRNSGPVAVDHITVQLVMRSEELVEPAGCRIPDGKPRVSCPIGRLGPGEVTTLFFHQPISLSEPHVAINRGADLQVRVGDQKYREVQGIPLVYQ